LAHPIAFSGATGPLRLFNTALGDQGAWLLAFALVGLIAVGATLPRRPDRQWGPFLVLGGWFVVEAVVLSSSQGIVHPYYVSALGPGTAAMVGGGAAALTRLVRRRRWGWGSVLTIAAVGATVSAQLVLLNREHYLTGFEPYLAWGAGLGVLAIVALPSRWRGSALALVLALLLVAPTAYATTVWGEPVEGTFPAAGPHTANGPGGVGLTANSLPNYMNLIYYVRTHRPTARWNVLTDATSPASPLILLGVSAGAMGGYSGTDPVLDGPGLGRLVRNGGARYVLLGGAYASRGGNGATAAVAAACRQVPQRAWRGLLPLGPPLTRTGVLFSGPWQVSTGGLGVNGVTGPAGGARLRLRLTGHSFAGLRRRALVGGRPIGAGPGSLRAARGVVPGPATRGAGLGNSPVAELGVARGGGGPGATRGRLRPQPLPLKPFSFALYDCAGRAELLAATRG
jgi:4-amino-4-deoxy-L-arabinose transferase-like glycosyltransferase